MLIVFLLEAVVGGLAYIYENNISDELQQTLNNTFLTGYAIDERKTNAIDHMQQHVSSWFIEIEPFNCILIFF